jgi:hypothetical protein
MSRTPNDDIYLAFRAYSSLPPAAVTTLNGRLGDQEIIVKEAGIGKIKLDNRSGLIFNPETLNRYAKDGGKLVFSGNNGKVLLIMETIIDPKIKGGQGRYITNKSIPSILSIS